MAKFNFDIYQNAYCFAMASGGVGKLKGSDSYLQGVLKKALEKNIPTLTGDWSIGWGPRVFKKLPESITGGPDHTCFAIVDHNQKYCIVAVAGTADDSEVNKLENKQVDRVVNFKTWTDSWTESSIPEPCYFDSMDEKPKDQAYCAEGLCNGVLNILNSPSNDDNSKERLNTYLSGLGEDYTIIFTGHSLGGGIVPILALGLHQSKLVNNKNLKVLPSAGVSPGNDVFANEFSAVFPPSQNHGKDYQIFNTVYYNVNDFVPQAWSLDKNHDRNMDNIWSIYNYTPFFGVLVSLYFSQAKGLSEASGIDYTPLNGTAFLGVPEPTKDPIENKDELIEQHGTQHVLTYWDQIGIHEFMNAFEESISQAK